jgi:hypothetical protein
MDGAPPPFIKLAPKPEPQSAPPPPPASPRNADPASEAVRALKQADASRRANA